jgi:hypothetical protein
MTKQMMEDYGIITENVSIRRSSGKSQENWKTILLRLSSLIHSQTSIPDKILAGNDTLFDEFIITL